MPAVTERPLDFRSTKTRRGLTAVRAFDVEAASELDAYRVLAAEKGVDIDTPLTNAYGETPDDRVRVRRLEAEPASPTPIGGRGLWLVRATYDNTLPVPGGAPVFRWGRTEQTIAFEKDRDGKAISNSRGEPYDPLPVKVVPNRSLTVGVFRSQVSLAEIFAFDGKVNDRDFVIAGRWRVNAGQALFHGIDPFEEQDGQVRLEIHIEFRPGGALWEPFQIVDYTVRDGQRIYLDGAGNETTIVAGQDPVVNEFSIYDTADPTGLGI